MKRWKHIDELSREIQKSAVSVGNFDGVHMGHQSIVDRLLGTAQKRRLPSVVITFEPHPAKVLGYDAPPLLTTPHQRGDFLEKMGVDHFVVQPFDVAFSKIEAEEFVQRWLTKKIGMEFLCIGPTTHVGKGRAGTPRELKDLAKKYAFELQVVSALEIEGEMVSSSCIRKLIQKGEVRKVNKYLGRPHCTMASIVSGAGRGKDLGFPTLNLESPDRIPTLLPKKGVYAAIATLGGKRLPSATNVGFRPTFADKELVVEAHLIDFKGKISTTEVTLEWISRIRDEQKFSSAETLKAQIQKDCNSATQALIESGFQREPE